MSINHVKVQSENRGIVEFMKPISYDKCCFLSYNTVYDCGPTSHREFYTSPSIGICVFSDPQIIMAGPKDV